MCKHLSYVSDEKKCSWYFRESSGRMWDIKVDVTQTQTHKAPSHSIFMENAFMVNAKINNFSAFSVKKIFCQRKCQIQAYFDVREKVFCAKQPAVFLLAAKKWCGTFGMEENLFENSRIYFWCDKWKWKFLFPIEMELPARFNLLLCCDISGTSNSRRRRKKPHKNVNVHGKFSRFESFVI